MIQGATMDDVREFSPTYRAIKHVVAKRGPYKKGGTEEISYTASQPASLWW
jgi:hypothetical protein